MAFVGQPEPVELFFTSRCRDLRRALAPVVWTVLAKVVLDVAADRDRDRRSHVVPPDRSAALAWPGAGLLDAKL